MNIDTIRTSVGKCIEARLHINITIAQYDMPVLSDDVGIEPWGIIYLIDEISKQFNFKFYVDKIVENPMFTLNDLVNTIDSQLNAL